MSKYRGLKWEKIKSHEERDAIFEVREKTGLKVSDFTINTKGQVTKLNLRSKKLTKIPKQIKQLINLKELSLDYNQITKIENLENLKNLKELSLYRNKITKIEGLNQLANLIKLNLRFNEIEIMEGLDMQTNLRFLELGNNKIQEIDGIHKLPRLEKLYLNGNPLKDDDLKFFHRLKDLYPRSLSASPIRDYVRKKHINEEEEKNIKKLESRFTSLTYEVDENGHISDLNLSGAGLRRVPVEISGFHHLKTLFLVSNMIKRIEHLENLTQLKDLRLQFNQIQKIEGLNALKSLEYLFLSNNYIEKIEGLETCVGLIEIHLSSNKITKIEGLSRLQKLRQLNLKNNQISKLESIYSLKALRNFDLSGNPLEEGDINAYHAIIDELIEKTIKDEWYVVEMGLEKEWEHRRNVECSFSGNRIELLKSEDIVPGLETTEENALGKPKKPWEKLGKGQKKLDEF